QATAYLPDGVLPVLKARAQRLQNMILPREWDAELLQGGHRLLRPGALRSGDALEPEPEVVHPGLRMAAGDLDHDTPAGMGGEGVDEGTEVRHLIEDVVTDDDVGGLHPRCHLGPGPQDRPCPHRRLPGAPAKPRHL